MAKGRAHRLRSLVLVLLGVAIAAAVVFAVSVLRGVSTIQGAAEDAMDAAAALQQQIDDFDLATASKSASLIARSTDEMVEVTRSWSWRLAMRLPVVGSDVRVATELVDAMDLLANKVAVPVVSQLDQLVDGSVAGGAPLTLSNVQNDATTLALFLDTVEDAGEWTREIDDVLHALQGKPVHADELAAGIDQATEKVDELVEVFDGLSPTLDLAQTVSLLFGGLTQGATIS